jgi:hypothetical protein
VGKIDRRIFVKPENTAKKFNKINLQKNCIKFHRLASGLHVYAWIKRPVAMPLPLQNERIPDGFFIGEHKSRGDGCPSTIVEDEYGTR